MRTHHYTFAFGDTTADITLIYLEDVNLIITFARCKGEYFSVERDTDEPETIGAALVEVHFS